MILKKVITDREVGCVTMDRELVKKITRLVIEVLDDMNQTSSASNNGTVKIWSHKSPLPESIELTPVKAEQPKNMNKMVNITPYLKK